jgi:hypothetical protein
MKEITVEIANINDAVSLPPPTDLFSKPYIVNLPVFLGILSIGRYQKPRVHYG